VEKRLGKTIDRPTLGRSGRGVSVSTVWIWTLRGVRGVKLETLMVGGIR
jgi:hypothetical protein